MDYTLSNVTKEYLSAFTCIFAEMILGMTSASLTDSISHNFITQMIPHHQAAIRMSENILRYTTDLTLQGIAEGIIDEQTKGIAEMQAILKSCDACSNSQQDLLLYQRRTGLILRTMFTDMGSARATNAVNCDFMWEMIPHHRGAVRMSENALQYSLCPELKPILEEIITSQKRGIQEMQTLLRRLRCC